MHTTEQLNTALDGRYIIQRRIGAGGMAVVYLAQDLKHRRLVALKVLNPELGAVLVVERFMSEIQVMANLHHPNLLPLFDSGEAGGLLFYAMPFVEGETLRQRLLNERQLAVDESVRIATSIASALDYAHRHNVIHRDLKPENILMHEGQPLVMDFGIALAVSKAGGARITQTGLSLGTPQYMSPEQATGDHALDARTDIYSLGAVLYEMLVGDPPHTGSTVQAVIAKVITENPRSVRATRNTVPESIEAAVMTALAKVPADRFASAADFAAALVGRKSVSMPSGSAVSTTASGATAAVPASRIRSRELVAWTAAVAATLTAVWLVTRRSTTPAAELGQFEVVLPDSVSLSNLAAGSRVAISQDGSLLAFSVKTNVSSRALFVRSADNSVSYIVNGAEGSSYPAFSPDNKWLLYSVPGRLMKIPVTGGSAILLVTDKFGRPITTSSWGDDNRIAYSTLSDLWITNQEGDTPRRLAGPDSARGIRGVIQPDILPGSKHALVTVLHGNAAVADSAELAVVSLDDGSITPLGVRGFAPRFAAPGFILFGRSGDVVYAAPFSLSRRAVTAPAVRILDHVFADLATTSVMSVARNGWLVYATRVSAPATELVAVDQHGTERRLPFEARPFGDPAISPDGRRIGLRISAGAFSSGNLWIYDLQNGTPSRLTSDSMSYRPAWSRDGSRILYLNNRSTDTRILSRPWDNSGVESVVLTRGSLAEIATGPAGGLTAIRTLDGPRDIYIAPTDSLAALKPFVVGPADETNPAISPDGKWLAYQSNETGPYEVYVRPIPGPGARVPVSAGGGVLPRWSPDGHTLYYRSPTHVMAARLSAQKDLDVVKRDPLFVDIYDKGGEGQGWDVFPNGKEFLLLKGQRSTPPKIVIVVNWQRLMKGAEKR
jgi:serine/threonine-protein kinase